MFSNSLRESRGKNIAEVNAIYGEAAGESRDLSGEKRIIRPSI